ncbi:cytochrome P450 [Exidia glandulosa HHB12029]|uniref:Cytochrome P450 n=1 Tax=Exidia glandulosa HHB12029 TaxID=1314781 RepID=A0A165P853_EXIGL|nr:cytochrome P450 [Exidia glandulosa HHB12029]
MDSATLGAVSVALAFTFGLAVYNWRRTSVSALPLPPGPPARGLLGNLTDVPTSHEWKTYAEWGLKYGPVSHFRILTRHVVILNTLEAAVDLLDKRSGNYSDRPQFTMMCELMGWNWNMGLMPYGEYWRTHRKIIQHFLPSHPDARAEKYHESQTRATMHFLRALLDTPAQFYDHVRRLTAAGILAVSHGRELGPTADDPWVVMADEAADSLVAAGFPGSWAVDWLPLLKYVPAWIPGASFKRKANEWRKTAFRPRDLPFDWVENELISGRAVHSVAADLIQNGFGGKAVPGDVMRNVTGIIHIGGADTTVSVLHSFMALMVLNPDAQRRAQEQIDAVLGPDLRLPTFDDRVSLPLVEAIVLETFRMYPPGPLGVAHRSMKADQYKGIYIPAGTTILANSWAILRDETSYPDPHSFKPERFLAADGSLDRTIPDPRIPVFGFGRRVCPGKHFADDAVWLAVASTLACFTIRHKEGDDRMSDIKLRSGFITGPERFNCSITPRSNAVKRLIVSATDHA